MIERSPINFIFIKMLRSVKDCRLIANPSLARNFIDFIELRKQEPNLLTNLILTFLFIRTRFNIFTLI